MSKGKGGKIKNWKSTGRYSWEYQGNKDARAFVSTDGISSQGRLAGKDVPNKSITPKKSRKEDARKMVSNWLRRNTKL